MSDKHGELSGKTSVAKVGFYNSILNTSTFVTTHISVNRQEGLGCFGFCLQVILDLLSCCTFI